MISLVVKKYPVYPIHHYSHDYEVGFTGIPLLDYYNPQYIG